MRALPPLSLYVHLPWCERKCPYCDFNSYQAGAAIPERAYLESLRQDLLESRPLLQQRAIETVFIGGGTPSLFSGSAIAELMVMLATEVELAAELEVTLEANPGSAEQARFDAYRAAGVNRLSLGIQSFCDEQLRALGRVHDAREAQAATAAARAAGFDRINLDLMHGLPGQGVAGALADLEQALDCDGGHLSWYQLTIEPNTAFARKPPVLPQDDSLADIQERGHALLQGAGYQRYEISAYARETQRCRHNLNYWEFGDYLGIGAGAHGKISFPDGRIKRVWKTRSPSDYMNPDKTFSAGERWLQTEELPLEFLMNALRLCEGVPSSLLPQRTGLDPGVLQADFEELRQRGLMAADPARLQATPLGLRFLNDLLATFSD